MPFWLSMTWTLLVRCSNGLSSRICSSSSLAIMASVVMGLTSRWLGCHYCIIQPDRRSVDPLHHAVC
ncbi:UNVERIFIED_CONTAM: hypothetical protein K0B97_07665 [Spiribacter pallidus]